MASAFELLGLSPDADAGAIRAAYHRLVKAHHPDRFLDPLAQAEGQQKLIGINVAYQECMRIAGSRQSSSAALPLKQAKDWAIKLLERKQYELALLQLSKAEDKDAQWYALQGQTLRGLKQHVSAHQAFRAAVRLEPDNLDYRRDALDAEMALKKENTLPRRAIRQIRSLFARDS